MALISGEFFGDSGSDSVPAILMRDMEDGTAFVFVLDALRGPTAVLARVMDSEDDMAEGDQMIFVPDAE
jgi:hypothetical protein